MTPKDRLWISTATTEQMIQRMLMEPDDSIIESDYFLETLAKHFAENPKRFADFLFATVGQFIAARNSNKYGPH